MAVQEQAQPAEVTRPEIGALDVPVRLAEGVELLGQYQSSGFKDPPYLVRRPDGQMIQLPPLLYAVAERLDGRQDLEGIAVGVTESFGRGVSADDVRYLAEKKLAPLGLLSVQDPSVSQVKPPDPLLALRLRTAVVPSRVVNAITRVFLPLFLAVVVVAALGALGLFDWWLFGLHGVGQSLREVIYRPLLLFLLLGAVIVSAAFHEIGHATACRYSGARPGAMGVGLYIVWPAFYTDVTDAYRLNRRGRLRTDLGGVYFNAIFVLAVGLAYLLTRFEPLLLLALLVQLEILQQFLPFLRLDGYYMISDLTGVPDLFTRIGPTLKSLLPWRETDQRVAELRPGVRVTVTLWVLLLVPILTFNFAVMVFAAPRIFATIWGSLKLHWHSLTVALPLHQFGAVALNALQMAVLALPALGIAYMLTRVSRRLFHKGWTWSADNRIKRSLVIAIAMLTMGTVAFAWWPKGEYRPIEPHERWTLPRAISAIAAAPSGQPAFLVPSGRQTRGPAASAHRVRHSAPVSGRRSGPAGSAPASGSGASSGPPPSPSPSPSPSVTPSPTPSPTTSPSPSPSPSSTPTPSPSASATVAATQAPT